MIARPPEDHGVLVPGRHTYRYEGRSRTLSIAVDHAFADRWTGSVVAREYEPRGRPDRPHVYLITPVHPATTHDVRLHLNPFIAALAEAFDLRWHTADWPASAMGCGVVLAGTAAAAGWRDATQADVPGLRIPIAWVREPHKNWMRDRHPDREVCAADVVACLGHRLPVWAAGTHDAASIAAWRSDGRQVPHAVPHDLADMWRICQYAAGIAGNQPGQGFVELATESHRFIAREIQDRNLSMDKFDDAVWKSAASFTLPPLPNLPTAEKVSLLNATNVLHGSPATPSRLGEVLHRPFGDPTRGAPMVVHADELPRSVVRTMRRAPVVAATTPRARHLLSAAKERYQSPTWLLHQDSHDTVDHLYATSDTHVAWLAAGEWVSPHLGNALLPAQPHELVLVRDGSGTLGGWVFGIDENCVPFPFAGTPGHVCVAVAEIVTGSPLGYAFNTHMERLLHNLPNGSTVTYQWHTAQGWAAEFPAGRPSLEGPLSFKATARTPVSAQRPLPRLIAPAPARLPWDDFGAKPFEDLVCHLANADGRFAQCQPHTKSGHGDDGVDGIGRVIQPADPGRPYLAIQCKRRRSFGPAEITEAVETFLAGGRAAKTDTFVLAVSLDLATRPCAIAIEQAGTELAKQHIKLEVWQDFQLSQRLRGRPELVATYFSDFHAAAFCRDTA